jgi:hypothetical protein
VGLWAAVSCGVGYAVHPVSPATGHSELCAKLVDVFRHGAAVSLHCRCAVYVQDICTIVAHLISTAEQKACKQCHGEAPAASSSCTLLGLPHSIYNMVRPCLALREHRTG